MQQDHNESCQEIAGALDVNHMAVRNRLKRTNYQKKLDVCVPHELTQRNLIDRITLNEMLIKRNEIGPFFENIKRK